MTNCELASTLIIGIVSSIIATYTIRFIDSRHKNNRHGSK